MTAVFVTRHHVPRFWHGDAAKWCDHRLPNRPLGERDRLCQESEQRIRDQHVSRAAATYAHQARHREGVQIFEQGEK